MVMNLENLSPHGLEIMAKEHLQYCNYQINGYWDDNEQFYEQIIFQKPLLIKLLSYGLEKSFTDNQSPYLIKLKFALQADLSDEIIAQMLLVYDHNFKFIDEQWLINTHSNFVITQS